MPTLLEILNSNPLKSEKNMYKYQILNQSLITADKSVTIFRFFELFDNKKITMMDSKRINTKQKHRGRQYPHLR